MTELNARATAYPSPILAEDIAQAQENVQIKIEEIAQH